MNDIAIDANEATQCNAKSETEKAMERKRAAVRALLIREFHVESVFVGVPKLSRILGIATTTIYAYIRQRKFFLPYRLINTTVMVSVEDLVDWYCDPPEAFAPVVVTESIEEILLDEGRQDPIVMKKIDPTDRIVEEALMAMGIDPKSSRARRRARM